jgi:hypothetical protein
MIKSGKKKSWTWGIWNCINIFIRKCDGKRPRKNLGLDMRITAKWMLTKTVHVLLIRFFWLRIDTSGRLY